MTSLDDRWDAVSSASLRDFLDDFLVSAASEGLAWEAKGPRTLIGDVRKKVPEQICAFANATGGYLILGVEQDEATGEWTQDGVSIPDREPNLWITRLVGDKVRPAPRIETKWACVTPDPAERRYVTITCVHEAPVRPCLVGGVAWERHDSETRRVLEPEELRRLISNGLGVIVRAQEDALGAAKKIYDWAWSGVPLSCESKLPPPGRRNGFSRRWVPGHNSHTFLQCAVGLATTGRASDVAELVNSRGYHDELFSHLEGVGLRRPSHYNHQGEAWLQEAYIRGAVITHSDEKESYVALMSEFDGAVAIYCREEVLDGTLDELIAFWVQEAWCAAFAMQALLKGFGEYCVAVLIDPQGLSDVGRAGEPIIVRRGPFELPPERRYEDEVEAHLADIRAAVLRALNQAVYERSSDLSPNYIEGEMLRDEPPWSPKSVHKALILGRNFDAARERLQKTRRRRR